MARVDPAYGCFGCAGSVVILMGIAAFVMNFALGKTEEAVAAGLATALIVVPTVYCLYVVFIVPDDDGKSPPRDSQDSPSSN